MDVRFGALGLRTGASLINTGALFDGTNFLNEDSLKVNFLTASVSAQFNQALGSTELYLFAGPEVRYLINFSDADADFATFREQLDPISITGALGLGFRLKFMGYRLGPEVRYALDLTGLGDRTFSLGDARFRTDEPFKLNNLIFGLIIGR